MVPTQSHTHPHTPGAQTQAAGIIHFLRLLPRICIQTLNTLPKTHYRGGAGLVKGGHLRADGGARWPPIGQG